MSLYDALINSKNKSGDFTKLFDKLTVENDILANCTLELTPLCNFRCAFCYSRVSPEELKKRNVSVKRFDEWKRYIDDAAQMHCMTLILTGGECTLHPDFCKIYSYAYDKGLTISVFTNGSNITDEIFEMFTQKPPFRIFITLYGNSPETYEKVVGDGKYFSIVRKNVEALVAKKFDVVLQGTFVSDNVEDVEPLYDYAASLGCEFRYNSDLFTLGNNTAELNEAIKADDDFMKQASKNIWCKKHNFDPNGIEAREKKRVSPLPVNPEAVGIKCNAGKNACFIRHDGMMAACNTLDAKLIDTHGRSLQDCFREMSAWANTVPRIKECEGCIHAIHCRTCVAIHYSDTHQFGVPSPRLCFKIREPEKAKAEQEFFAKHGYLEL